jgi:hypothetical protein
MAKNEYSTNEDGTKTVMLRVTPEVHAVIKGAATSANLSVNSLGTSAILSYISGDLYPSTTAASGIYKSEAEKLIDAIAGRPERPPTDQELLIAELSGEEEINNSQEGS